METWLVSGPIYNPSSQFWDISGRLLSFIVHSVDCRNTQMNAQQQPTQINMIYLLEMAWSKWVRYLFKVKLVILRPWKWADWMKRWFIIMGESSQVILTSTAKIYIKHFAFEFVDSRDCFSALSLPWRDVTKKWLKDKPFLINHYFLLVS